MIACKALKAFRVEGILYESEREREREREKEREREREIDT